MRQLEQAEQATQIAIKYAEVQTAAHAPTHLFGWLPIIWSRVLFGGAPVEPTTWRWRPCAAIFLLSGILLYPCVSFHLFEPDEGRYAQIPFEMLTSGELIVPTLQGEPYLDKPPLFYWLVMMSYSLFGFHDGAARLVPALAMHATVLLTYVLGRRMVGERSAFWGALLLTVSPIFLGIGRLLVLDGLLALWITLALLAAYVAQSGTRLQRGWWFVAALACGLGVLTKGPIAVVLVLMPRLVNRWFTREGEAPAEPHAAPESRLGGSLALPPNALRVAAPISCRAWTGFVGVVLAVNLPWYVAVCVQRPEFVRHFLWQHHVQRFVEPFDHVRPVWFYLPILLYGLLPIVLLAWPIARFLTSTRTQESSQRCPALGYLLLAGGWCVFFFSLAGSKLPTYILPAFPVLCLALGCFIARTDWRKSRWVFALVAIAWLVQAAANQIAVPAYARSRAPMSDFEAMRERCGDRSVPVVCFPRNIDSVAFYVGRSDFRTFRSKGIDELVRELDRHPRTVVLFGHRNSPETLARHLPPHLRMVDRRPMGLCESAIIERN